MLRSQNASHKSYNSKFAIFFLLLTLLFVHTIYGQNNAEKIAQLEQGKVLEREIAGGAETHVYQVALNAGRYAKISVEQHGADVAAKILAADGKIINKVNSESAANGVEILEIVADASGNYRIEIKSSLPKAAVGRYSIRLMAIRAATANEESLDAARRGFYELTRLRDAGNFDQAIEIGERVLAVREKMPEANPKETISLLINLSYLYLTKNNLAQAEVFQRQAAEAAAKNFGEESLPYADALSILARIRRSQANYVEAEPLCLKALAIYVKAIGENSVPSADAMHNLALIYRASNDYPKAELNFTKALAIYEKLFGDDRLEMASLLNDFGMFYYGAGDFPAAEKHLSRSIKIKKNLFPEEHRQVGIAFNNLGLVAWKSGDYEKAKEYYLRALKIFEIVNGPESDGVANILGNLAIIYKESDKDLSKAEEFDKRSLAITVKNFGENHQLTANAISRLSITYRAMGDYDRAEQFGLRAHAINENVLGEYNHYSILSLGNLIKIYTAKGDTAKAVEYLQKLAEIHEKVIPLNLLTGSERQKIAYYKQTNRFDSTISLHVKSAPDNATMRDLAVTAVLRHKGRVLDAVSENLSSLQTRFAPEDRKLLDALTAANSQLSQTLLSNRRKLSVEEQKKRVKHLEEEREKIEAEISLRSAGFYQPTAAVTLERVRRAIPADAALVEFAVYRPYNSKTRQNEPEYGAPHYAVYVVLPNGQVHWRELGETAALDKIISEFRAALNDPKNPAVEQTARALDEKIMKPLRPVLEGARHLLVSPDGNLNLIPFEALIDESGKYLIENYSFSYLTSGRDLLRMRQPQTVNKSKSLIVANPTFGASPSALLAKVSNDPKTSRKRRSVTATNSLSETYFAPLGGANQEARLLQTLFPDAIVLTEAQATESALKKSDSPQLLHIATHGFFLKNSDEIKTKSNDQSRQTNDDESENPLLLSGLALAGANRRDSGADDDGILTALEASGLNLWGTKLVVLSACDTGIGKVKNGDGVYGLRRAFVLAGTESLVMSLWSVSDYATRELMTEYYKNLKNGMGRGAALQKVKLEMLKKKGREHPFYWASFIESGEWATLDGKR